MSEPSASSLPSASAPIDYAALARPFTAQEVKWRIERLPAEPHIGRKVPYIAAHQVQARLDEIVLPHRWAVSFTEVFSGARLATVRCKLSIQQADGTWLAKEDAGAVPQAAARGEALDLDRIYKGAYSDALKRAAVQWGIGRSLKLLGPTMVRLDDNGNEIGPLVDTTLSNSQEPPSTVVQPQTQPQLSADLASEPQADEVPPAALGAEPPAPPLEQAPPPAQTVAAPAAAPVETPVASESPAPSPAASATEGASAEFSDTYNKAKLRIDGGRVPAGPMLSYLNSDMAKEGLRPGEHELLVTLLKKKYPDAFKGA